MVNIIHNKFNKNLFCILALRKLYFQNVISLEDYFKMKSILLKKCQRKKDVFFNFDKFNEDEYKIFFRFNKQDIIRLQVALKLPEVIKLGNGTKISGI